MARVEIEKRVPEIMRPFVPWQRLRELLSWDPFAEIGSPLTRRAEPVWVPAFDVKETKESFIFKADVPGIKQEDLELSIAGNRLTISGKREAEQEKKDEKSYAYEREFGSFTRSFTLPQGVDTDHIHAELQDGVLTVTLPKSGESRERKIQIATAPKAKS